MALIAGMVGLTAILVVQTAAKAEIARALNRETVANAELTRSHAAVQARYDLAVEAIKTFHTGVSEDFLLKEEGFKALRDRLLKSASDFYGKLGALLGQETDFASRRALAQAEYEVAELTAKVGRTEAALEAHRRVLASREALAADPEADAETQAEVGRSLTAVALLLEQTGKAEGAVATYREAERRLSEAVAASPTAAPVRRRGRLPVPARLPAAQHGPHRRGDANAPTGGIRSGGAVRGRRGDQRRPERPGGDDRTDRLRAVGDRQAGGGGARVPPRHRHPAGAGRPQPRRHRLPEPAGAHARHPRHSARGHEKVRGGWPRVPQGPGVLPGTGRRQPRRHRLPKPAGAHPRRPGPRARGHGKAGGGGGRIRPRASPSSRSWPTTTPPSPTSESGWR